jgi:ethanolamine utilization cobalamin adenosyltransferase
MEEEIKCAEKKLEEKKQMQLKKQEEEARLRAQEPDSQQQPKKNVFAKLKKYNKIDAKPNTNPNTKTTTTNSKKDDTDDKVLKERANRYSCEGKLANFSFLKKVDRKLVDSKYAMSFSEFKKLSMNQTKNA